MKPLAIAGSVRHREQSAIASTHRDTDLLSRVARQPVRGGWFETHAVYGDVLIVGSDVNLRAGECVSAIEPPCTPVGIGPGVGGRPGPHQPLPGHRHARVDELESQVDAALRALLEDHGHRVYRDVLFSSRPLTASWRYLDQFQIGPAPDNAPRPNVVLAEHPFIVDVIFADGPSEGIRRLRCQRRVAELRLLLNLILRSRIMVSSNRIRSHWVWEPMGSIPRVRWAQEGYFIEDFQYLVDELPSLHGTEPLITQAPDLYYDTFAGSSDVVTGPNEITELVDAFERLDAGDRPRFLRSMFWFATAPQVFSYSQSLHLTCLVNAVECLATSDRGAADTGGPTKSFIAFMREYVPGQPSKTRLSTLYSLRSDVAHGGRLMAYDQVPAAPGLNQTSAVDQSAGDDASLFCRAALLNWLWEKGGHQDQRLLSKSGRSPRSRAKPGTKSSTRVIVA